VKAGTEDSLAFWAIPLDKRGHRDGNSTAAKSNSKRVPLPAEARQQVLARAGAAEAQLAR
jgi:hypothetical protein